MVANPAHQQLLNWKCVEISPIRKVSVLAPAMESDCRMVGRRQYEIGSHYWED